jgi:hypothetical protein
LEEQVRRTEDLAKPFPHSKEDAGRAGDLASSHVDPLWPTARSSTPPQPLAEPAPVVARLLAQAARAAQRTAWTKTSAGVSILKSGVVDGMPYTLYSDGSIEAQLPGGTLRFNSINELRSHIEQNG